MSRRLRNSCQVLETRQKLIIIIIIIIITSMTTICDDLTGRFTFWISVSLRLSLSPKFGLRQKISQKVNSFFV